MKLLLPLCLLAAGLLGGCSSEPTSEAAPTGPVPASTSTAKKGAPTLSAAPTPGLVATPEAAEARAGSALGKK